jgi:biotin carboxyl carrier protein
VKFQYKVSGKRFALDGQHTGGWKVTPRPGGWLVLERARADGGIERQRLCVTEKGGKLSVQDIQAGTYFGDLTRQSAGSGAGASGASEADFKAQFPGKVRKVLVQDGARVAAGDKLLLLEAMKMEFAIQAPVAGFVKSVKVKEGQQLSPGELLIDFEEVKDQ